MLEDDHWEWNSFIPVTQAEADAMLIWQAPTVARRYDLTRSGDRSAGGEPVQYLFEMNMQPSIEEVDFAASVQLIVVTDLSWLSDMLSRIHRQLLSRYSAQFINDVEYASEDESEDDDDDDDNDDDDDDNDDADAVDDCSGNNDDDNDVSDHDDELMIMT